jgi:hypothetical protein
MTISRQSGDSQERPIENIPESGTPIHMQRQHNYPNYVAALSSEPIPLHGIHYFEIKIKSKINPTLPQTQLKQVFVGLTALNPGQGGQTQ